MSQCHAIFAVPTHNTSLIPRAVFDFPRSPYPTRLRHIATLHMFVVEDSIMIDIFLSHRLLFMHPHRSDAEPGNSRHDGDQFAVKTEPCATRLAGNEDWQKLVEVSLHCWTRFNPGLGLNQSQGEMRRWWRLSPNTPNEVIRKRKGEAEASGRDCPACTRVGREVGSGTQSPLGVLKAVCNRRAGWDGCIGRSRGHWSCPGFRRPA